MDFELAISLLILGIVVGFLVGAMAIQSIGQRRPPP